MNFKLAQTALLEWYGAHARELPWRENRDPYRIWISETMLQQTTTTAVIPYFERFLKTFPTLKALAKAPLPQVLEAWAGLGYYSRARNLHKAAQWLHSNGFPTSWSQLIELPGFGPYTARSVASLAFDESVGVVDGNTIRVLSRVHGEDWDWWMPRVRAQIQARADQWVEKVSSYHMNQALMELGRTICMPRSPTCLLCPLRANCMSFRQELVAARPKAKPKRAREIWVWEVHVEIEKDRVRLVQNSPVPFLRDSWLPPGTARQVKSKPKHFHYKHSITHHDIYVTVATGPSKIKYPSAKWIRRKEIRQYAPASIVEKAVAQALQSQI